MSLFSDYPQAIEAASRSMAERASGMIARRDDQPVDVCRWHRDLADAALAAFFAALPQDVLLGKFAAAYTRSRDEAGHTGSATEVYRQHIAAIEDGFVAIGLIPEHDTATEESLANAKTSANPGISGVGRVDSEAQIGPATVERPGPRHQESES